MSITAAEFMIQCGYMLMEDGWERNGLWSTGEVIGYINTVCKDFALRTQFQKEVFGVASVTAGRLYDDPHYTVNVDRVVFAGRALYETNRYMLDRENPSWETRSGVPRQFHEDQLPTKTFETDRAPTSDMTGAGYTASIVTGTGGGALRGMVGSFGYNPGTMLGPAAGGIFRYNFGSIAYNATSPPSGGGLLREMLDGATNFEVLGTQLPADIELVSDVIPLPKYTIMFIKYGVLQKMLAKEGEGQDLVRAKYCGARYDNGIALFQRLLSGKDLVGPRKGNMR